jgi:hypothetical protein
VESIAAIALMGGEDFVEWELPEVQAASETPTATAATMRRVALSPVTQS